MLLATQPKTIIPDARGAILLVADGSKKKTQRIEVMLYTVVPPIHLCMDF